MGDHHHRPRLRERNQNTEGAALPVFARLGLFCIYRPLRFRINSGEYKLMGLAPHGKPKYADIIRCELIDLKPDGSFWLNLDYSIFCAAPR